MRCPRCTLTDLNEKTQTCVLCGYSAALPTEAPSAAPAAPTELDARRELAREFQIERLLEQGTTPIAYVARDAEDRALILKAVPLAQLGAPADRVLATVEAAARLDHPHIVPIQASGTTEHFLWVASRYVEGRSLKDILGTVGSMELPVCLRIFEQVASALDYAHRRGVAHDALTPECIIVDANEWVLVGAFGTAGLLAPPPTAGPAAGDPAAADQRTLATIVRQCLAGAGNGRPALPLHVSQALRRAQSVRTADRFQSVLDFVAALEGGGARPEAQPAWFGAKPRQGSGNPVVIADSDADPAAAPRWRGRVAAALGLATVLAASASWLGGKSSFPAAPVSHTAAGPPTSASPVPTPAPIPPRDSARVGPNVASPPPAADATPAADTTPAAKTTPPARVPAPRPRAPEPAAPRPAAPSRPPARAPVTTASPPPATVEYHAEPALLSVNAIPWGSVYVDGRAIGNTPQIDLAVPPGTHRLRVERDGFRPYERVIELAPGQRLRVTDIALVER